MSLSKVDSPRSRHINHMRLTRLTTSEQFTALRPQWNALANGVPFRRWQWLENWWRVYGECPDGEAGRESLTLAVCDTTGTLIGLAPWYLEHSSQYGRVIRFLGSGEVCSD